jgi:hypothetical protein
LRRQTNAPEYGVECNIRLCELYHCFRVVFILCSFMKILFPLCFIAQYLNRSCILVYLSRGSNIHMDLPRDLSWNESRVLSFCLNDFHECGVCYIIFYKIILPLLMLHFCNISKMLFPLFMRILLKRWSYNISCFICVLVMPCVYWLCRMRGLYITRMSNIYYVFKFAS